MNLLNSPSYLAFFLISGQTTTFDHWTQHSDPRGSLAVGFLLKDLVSHSSLSLCFFLRAVQSLQERSETQSRPLLAHLLVVSLTLYSTFNWHMAFPKDNNRLTHDFCRIWTLRFKRFVVKEVQ